MATRHGQGRDSSAPGAGQDAGHHGGQHLDEKDIEIYVADEKPNCVPEKNWLPINRKNEEIDLILRIYVPDMEKIKTWKPPTAQKIK